MHAEVLLRSAVTLAGWSGQACFFARFLVQWLESERARRPVVPASFWWLSLAGAALVGLYAAQRGAGLLVLGFAITALISVRNLRLTRRALGLRARRAAPLAWGLTALALWPVLAQARGHADAPGWLAIGLAGQLLWALRFPLQWWHSERAGHSHFPPAFWWLSLAGNGLLLAYALHLGDPIFVLGFLPGPLIQVRNLVLLRPRQA